MAGEHAKKNLSTVQGKMKKSFNRHAEHRDSSLGDQVLPLLPVVTPPFQEKFSGPLHNIYF